MNRARQLRLDRRGEVVVTAKGAGISTKTLHKIEAGDYVDARAVARLADFYKVTPSELLAPAIFGAPDLPKEAA